MNFRFKMPFGGPDSDPGLRPPRIRGMSMNHMIPNILTLLALCAGLTAIRFALNQKFEAAVVAILIAGVFDGLDGRIARLLRGTSKFGAELDSLSDFVSFGVSPALVLYLWSMHGIGGLGWALALLYAVCCALRLARFNTMIGQPDLPPWAYNFFTGVPAPAGAGLVMLPMVLSFEFGRDFFGSTPVVGLFLVGTAMLMVSRLPTYSFKGVRVPTSYVLPLLLAVGVLASFLVTEPWLTLSAMGLIYLASIPVSLRAFERLSASAASVKNGESIAPAASVEANGDFPDDPDASDPRT